MALTDEIKLSYQHGSYLIKLIYINIIIWIVVRLAAVFMVLGGNEELGYIDWLALPSSFGQFLSRPWTLFTYMFLHYELLHILMNLLWLYSFGRIFLEYHQPRKLLCLYIFGGISGGLFFMAAYNLFPSFRHTIEFSRLLGASAAVITIVIATAVYVPNHVLHLVLIGPVKIKWIALVSVILYVVNLSGDNAGGNFAHLGGACWGFFYMTLLKSGIDLSSRSERFFDKLFIWTKPKKKLTVEYNSGSYREYGYNRSKKQQQEEVNRILDKISTSGYDALSVEEKEMLFRMSGKK
ncbi:MAG: rhomboid family intramembrane serine protease [Prolixibacteraceae bacterium]|jgi:membrane associated rhomboid family serine protease|nr:rhomboid family intramembrane serine protease [Prolixibacteraceae bacterium]